MNDRILRVLALVAKKPGTPEPDESLFDSGYLDSFTLADFVEALEAEFAVKVPNSDLTPRKFETVEKVANYLERI
jgi:acyl carrier protein